MSEDIAKYKLLRHGLKVGISSAGLGLLCLLLERKTISQHDIQQCFPELGRDRRQRIVQELISADLAERQKHDRQGRFSWKLRLSKKGVDIVAEKRGTQIIAERDTRDSMEQDAEESYPEVLITCEGGTYFGRNPHMHPSSNTPEHGGRYPRKEHL